MPIFLGLIRNLGGGVTLSTRARRPLARRGNEIPHTLPFSKGDDISTVLPANERFCHLLWKEGRPVTLSPRCHRDEESRRWDSSVVLQLKDSLRMTLCRALGGVEHTASPVCGLSPSRLPGWSMEPLTRGTKCVLEMCAGCLDHGPCLRGLASPFLFEKGKGQVRGIGIKSASRPADNDCDGCLPDQHRFVGDCFVLQPKDSQ